MSDLAPGRFAEFYEAVRGHEPFQWQADLADELVDSRFRDVIDVPTGFGKTSVIDCWAFALGVHASREPRGVPLRLCFVVDRRLVVDAAYDEALALADVLNKAEYGSGVAGEVAGALRSLHSDEDVALQVVRMRGGVTWESRWLARPDQAAVAVGTVDQFGSRLLFRGYGVSPSMRPIDAALVGMDSWLVIDEAHIAEPLTQTVDRVTTHQALTDLTSGRGLRVTRMSATVDGKGDVFRADAEEQTTSTRFPTAAKQAMKRLKASKPVALLDMAHLATGARKDWGDKAAQLGEAMAAIACRADEDARVIGVVANTIATARAAQSELVSRGEDAILLIGRVRGFERDRTLEEWIPKIRVGATRNMERRLFVVATQTIEVGANLDLDVLITECAPLSALVQRFGRVNRTGDRPVRLSAVVHAGFTHDDDPIYGEATSKTWRLLRRRGGIATVDRRDLERAWPGPSLDFGLRSVGVLMNEAPSGVNPQAPFVPIALGAHMERWAATNPEPFPDQPVAPFLHGIGRDVPELAIAWRARPPGAADDVDRWKEWLDLVPPVEWEFVSVPIWQAKAFLAGRRPDLPMSDLEGAAVDLQEMETDSKESEQLLGVIYRGPRDEASPIRGPSDIKAGDRAVLRSDVGGHDDWGWTGRRADPGDAPIPDIGDLAPTRRRGVLRLTRGVFDTWMPDNERLGQAFANLDSDEPDSAELTLQALSQVGLPLPLAGLVEKAGKWKAYSAESPVASSPMMLLTAPPAVNRGEDTASDDDEASTSQTALQVSISRHGEQVAATARRFAEHLALPGEVVRAVEIAGRWHDLGKADTRFQLMLHDGDRLSALAAAEPLAKSGRDSRDPLARRARQLAGLPVGFRHEAVSAHLFDALAAAEPSLLQGVDAELVRHLVVSHHGKARPLLPPLLDSTAPKVRIQVEGSEVIVDGAPSQVDWAQPARFEALNERYGWWGLALLECLVRQADMWCSEREE